MEDELNRDPHQELRQVFRDVSRIKGGQFNKHQENLEILAEDLSDKKCTMVEVKTKQLKHRERMGNDYKAVRKVTNNITKKRHGG